MRTNRKNPLPTRWLILLWMVTSILIASVTVAVQYVNFVDEPMQLDQEQVLVIKSGDSYSAVIRRLISQGWTQDYWFWRALGWRTDMSHRLRAGEYRITSGMTPRALLQHIASGNVITYQFTIVEGWNIYELRRAIREAPALVQTLSNDLTVDAFANALGLNHHPEGRFLPETYTYARGYTDVQLLQRAATHMDEVLQRVWNERPEDSLLESPNALLTLASIIEKETAVAEERGEIAGVFHRRLQRGMRLQTDPTVIYGIGPDFNGDITYRDLRTDTPYNTYTRHGLPPTPIAMPGAAAIRAAMFPRPGETLYFVATGDGGHHFSKTLAEHNAAVDRYQRGK